MYDILTFNKGNMADKIETRGTIYYFLIYFKLIVCISRCVISNDFVQSTLRPIYDLPALSDGFNYKIVNLKKS